MAQQVFYAEDTVRLKKDESRIGIIDRSFANVETHTPDPLQHTVNGNIERGSSIDPVAFDEFLQSGVPPRGTVLVTWIFVDTTERAVDYSTLISETELVLLDRALMFGDVVKRSTQDPMSGMVIGASTTVSLLQPSSWLLTHTQPDDRSVLPSTGHSEPRRADPSTLLTNIPVDDLTWPNEIERDQVVVYKGWTGVVEEIEEDIYVRLSNNSVVVPEDCSLIRTAEDDSCQVNDKIRCRKSSLRRGRWIYGAYNADVSPEGIVVDIRPRLVSVEWLVCNRPYFGQITPEQPPHDLEREELEDPLFHIYDRRRTPVPAMQRCNEPNHIPQNTNLDIQIGDRVRFKDLETATAKYGTRGMCSNGNTNSLIRIPRSETMGFDVNVFTVFKTQTWVDVLWQDGTTTKGMLANDLYPYLDDDNEEEVWPGELVVAKEDKSDNPEWHKPARTGIVQRVNANDRLAYVKWFRKGNVSFSLEQPSYLRSDARTGVLSDEIHEISLYDMMTVPDFARRLGDIVAIAPSEFTQRLLSSKGKNFPGQEGVRFALQEDQGQSTLGNASQLSNEDINDESQHENDWEPVTWLGEVIELGLDGLLTIRLGAHDPPLDIRVPWECTIVAHSSDNDEDYEYGDEASDTEEIWSDEESIASTLEEDGTEVWRDEAGNEVMFNTEEWSTEDDEGDDDSETKTPSNEDSEDEDEDVEMTDAPPEPPMEYSDEADSLLPKLADVTVVDEATSFHPQMPSEAFDYSSMFDVNNKEGSATDIGIGQTKPSLFEVLEGPAPEDHHFANRPSLTGGKALRRIHKEYQMLRESLPPGAYVRTWESRMNLMRLMLLGPIDTPYEYAPFLFDFYMDSSFPDKPPQVYFHSWTNGDGPCNPNLYEDGKVCLSLLGTWPGDDTNETWNSGKSSILQIIVSFLGLVLVKEPYYNEAGFESRIGTAESQIPSTLYSERTYFRTRGFIVQVLSNPVPGFDDVVRQVYLGARLLHRAIESGIDVVYRSSKQSSLVASTDTKRRRVSAGAVAPLNRQLERLWTIYAKLDEPSFRLLQSRYAGIKT